MITETQGNLLDLLEVALRQYNGFFRSGRMGKVKMAIRHPIKSLIRKLESLTLKQRFPFLVGAKTFFGCSIKVFGYSYQKDLWFCGLLGRPSDIRLTKYIIKNLTSRDIFFDVGAHHGFYSLLAHKIMGGAGQIHTFEPSPFHFNVLLKNVCCDSIFLNKTALAGSDGQIIFYDVKNGAGSSIMRPAGRGARIHMTTVLSTTLDRYCSSHKIKPSFLKIDIEGCEFEMLKGGKETLAAYKPDIAMEVLGRPYDYTNHLEAIAFLRENGYALFRINDDGNPEPISDIVPDRDIPFCSDNFIFKVP